MKFFKRAGAAALAIILSAGMLTAGAAYEDLTDKEAIVNKEAVQTLVELGVLDGRDDGSFDPAGTLTRQEGVKPAAALFEPDETTILQTAVPEYVTGRIMAAVRESYASEVVARRMAMDSAGKNAAEMLADLQLQYNRARQGSITQEITEIVAGANA